MSYIVIERFADLQDNSRIYEAGDEYPRPGFDVSHERLAELEGSDNLARKPLIVNADAKCAQCAVEAPETPAEAHDDESEEIPDQPVKSAQNRVEAVRRGDKHD